VKYLSIGIHTDCRDSKSASRAFKHTYVGWLAASLGVKYGLLGYHNIAVVGIFEE
jgi:hypothetical protein